MPVYPSRQDSLSIPPPHHWDSTYEFLKELKGFLSAMLRGENEGPPLQLHVDLDSLQSLPHGYLNASSEDVALLRQLLESHAPTLFRFPRRLEDLRGHRVELVLEADLLDLLNTRLTDTVAQIQRQMELQNHGGLPQLQRLLRGCFHLTQGRGTDTVPLSLFLLCGAFLKEPPLAFFILFATILNGAYFTQFSTF